MALRPNVAKLRDLLLKSKLVDEFQIRAAMGRLEQWGGRLTGLVVEMGFVDDETLTQTLSKALGLPTAHLGMVQKDTALLAKLSESFCEEHGVFPLSLQNRVLTLAMSDPTELDTVDLVASKLSARVQVVIAPEAEIKAAIAKHYRNESSSGARRKVMNREREAHIEATRGEVFELDTTAPPKPGENGAAASPSRAWMNKAPSANTMLDEFLDEEPKMDGFTAEEVKRIEAAVVNQRKTTAILTALRELLAEKGYLR